MTVSIQMKTINIILASSLVITLSSALYASELEAELVIQRAFIEWYRVELIPLEKQFTDVCLSNHFTTPIFLPSPEYGQAMTLLHKRFQYYQAQSSALDIQHEMCNATSISSKQDKINLAKQLLNISHASTILANLFNELETDFRNIMPYPESYSNE